MLLSDKNIYKVDKRIFKTTSNQARIDLHVNTQKNRISMSAVKDSENF